MRVVSTDVTADIESVGVEVMSLGADNVGTESVDSESVGTERLGADRLGTERLGTERLGADRPGAERLDAESVGGDRVGGDRVSADKFGAEMVGIDRLGADKAEIVGSVGEDTVKVGTRGVWMDREGRDSVGADSEGGLTLGRAEEGRRPVGADNADREMEGKEALGTEAGRRDTLVRETVDNKGEGVAIAGSVVESSSVSTKPVGTFTITIVVETKWLTMVQVRLVKGREPEVWNNVRMLTMSPSGDDVTRGSISDDEDAPPRMTGVPVGVFEFKGGESWPSWLSDGVPMTTVGGLVPVGKMVKIEVAVPSTGAVFVTIGAVTGAVRLVGVKKKTVGNSTSLRLSGAAPFRVTMMSRDPGVYPAV